MTEPQQEILNDLLNLENGLRPAELTFIEDLDQNWRGRPLSSKQLDWLLRIADRLL